MGNSKSKGSKSKSSGGRESGVAAKDSSISSIEFAAALPVSRLLSSGESTTVRRFKLWCKQQGEEKRLAQAVEFVEAVDKRIQVYKSGRRCGDSEETSTNHLRNNAQAIVDKFILASGARALALSDEEREAHSGDNINLDEKEAFDELKAKLLETLESALAQKQ